MAKRNKRTLLALVLALLAVLAGFIYTQRTPKRSTLQLVLKVKVTHREEDIFKVVLGAKEIEARLVGSGDWEELRFPLPDEKFDNLDIHLGLTPGVITLQSLRLEGAVVAHTFSGKILKTLFTFYPATAKAGFKKDTFQIKTTGILHWLRVHKSINRVIEQLHANKLQYYLISLLIGLVVFFLVRFVDIRGLRIFLDWRLVVSGLGMWLVILYFPLIQPLIKAQVGSELEEKRLINQKPELRLEALPRFFEQYKDFYNDFFPFRGDLIFLNSYLKFKLFGTASTDKVFVGKEGWLFFHKNGNQPSTVDYYRNLVPFTGEELQAWGRVLEARQKWLAARGISYIFMVIPNKNTIYPEYMPDYVTKAHPRSRMDQLLAYLGTHTSVLAVDLRPALRAAKGLYPLYYKTDSHWNFYGAYIGHKELIHFIARHCPGLREIQPIPFSRLRIQWKNIIGGDLAIMLSLHLEVLREDNVEVSGLPSWSYVATRLETPPNVGERFLTESKSSRYPQILMVHDSFYRQMKPYLSELFSRCYYIWDWGLQFYPEIIKKEKPVLVIDEMAERFLLNEKIPVNPSGLSN